MLHASKCYQEVHIDLIVRDYEYAQVTRSAQAPVWLNLRFDTTTPLIEDTGIPASAQERCLATPQCKAGISFSNPF